MKKYTALQAAQWFLSHNKMMAGDYGTNPLSNVKLNHLLYYAQGAFLSIMGHPLFEEDIVAGDPRPFLFRGVIAGVIETAFSRLFLILCLAACGRTKGP